VSRFPKTSLLSREEGKARIPIVAYRTESRKRRFGNAIRKGACPEAIE